jgi:aspartate kinase
MEAIVQKYGGSSLADAGKIKNVARRVARGKEEGRQIVVVASAMGDTTDELIALAHKITDSPDPREMDLLLSTGELVSCALVAMALRSIGVEAIGLSGFQAGILTDTTHGKARIHRIDTRRIEGELAEGRVVIVAGFQGVTKNMDVTTLGRGASDLTAIALAAALGAQRCEVYTDVEGIYTADPRIVPEARKLREISYEEMLELATLGAKMQARSIELAMVYNIPVYVASSLVDAPGTLIHGGVKEMEERKKVTGVAYDLNVAKLTVRAVPDRPGIAAAIFEPLAREKINVDVIVQNASADGMTDVSFTVSRTDLQKATQIMEQVVKQIDAKGVVADDKLAKVSIVGAGMQNAPGYAARMFRSLADKNINIEMITTSDIRITCIVQEAYAREAVRVLHRAFELEREE